MDYMMPWAGILVGAGLALLIFAASERFIKKKRVLDREDIFSDLGIPTISSLLNKPRKKKEKKKKKIPQPTEGLPPPWLGDDAA